MPTQPETDWSAWSREAVRLMRERNDAWVRDYGLEGCRYRWSLDEARIVFASEQGDVSADICVLGSLSASQRTFLWAWANEVIPAQARKGLEAVREFGEKNALQLLTRPEWTATRPDALEMAAIAGRVLDASGIWTETTEDVTLLFALLGFQRCAKQD